MFLMGSLHLFFEHEARQKAESWTKKYKNKKDKKLIWLYEFEPDWQNKSFFFRQTVVFLEFS